MGTKAKYLGRCKVCSFEGQNTYTQKEIKKSRPISQRYESVRNNRIDVLESKDSLKQRVKDNFQSIENIALLCDLEELPIETFL